MPTLAPPGFDTGADPRTKRVWETHPIAVVSLAAVCGFTLVLLLVVLLDGGGRDVGTGLPTDGPDSGERVESDAWSA